MTIDEAILHAEEVAEEHTTYNFYGGYQSCDKCAEEHRQLAEWLKELKELKARPTGKWIDHSDEGYVECPFCHSATNCEGNIEELHYCFSCGAYNGGEQE